MSKRFHDEFFAALAAEGREMVARPSRPSPPMPQYPANGIERRKSGRYQVRVYVGTFETEAEAAAAHARAQRILKVRIDAAHSAGRQ